MAKLPSGDFLQIRRVPFLPSDLELTPSNPSDVRISPNGNVVLAALFGVKDGGSSSAGVFPWGALQVAAYGSGYKEYDTKTGSAPASYSTSHELRRTGGFFHRWDILIETQEASIRFLREDAQEYGDDIPLNIGYHSIEFTSSVCQIKYRTASGGTYTIVGYC